MGYTTGVLKELRQALDSAGSILPFGDTVYRGPTGSLKSFEPYRAKNIFSKDTFSDDLALQEATQDLYESQDILNRQLIRDGLSPVDLPKKRGAEDLGEMGQKLPTKYGMDIMLPVGTTKGYHGVGEDKIVFNKRIIYGTKEHKKSLNLYKAALKIVEKHIVEPVKKILKPFYKKKIKTMESKYESREEVKETMVHELVHGKQEEAGEENSTLRTGYKRPGLIYTLIRMYGGVTDQVRDVLERHCTRYTSRVLGRRSTDEESSYGRLETQAMKSENRNGIGPQTVLQIAENRGPNEAAKVMEHVYGHPANLN